MNQVMLEGGEHTNLATTMERMEKHVAIHHSKESLLRLYRHAS